MMWRQIKAWIHRRVGRREPAWVEVERRRTDAWADNLQNMICEMHEPAWGTWTTKTYWSFTDADGNVTSGNEMGDDYQVALAKHRKAPDEWPDVIGE
mgnify:CR=1 FL=1